MTRKITALKQQRKNPDRVSVFLDDEYAFGLTKIVAAWLKKGQELSEEKIAELLAQDEVEIALLKAYNFLSYRPRTEKEMRDRLKKYGFEEPVVDEILERLKRHSYINDGEFAEMWVDNRSQHRPRGARALRMELRQKGVVDKLINTALEELPETELAYRAAKKKSRRYRDLEWQDFQKKMVGFLARRGFNYDDIRVAVQKVWDEQEHESDTELDG